MKHSMASTDRIEVILVGIFKLIIIVALCIALAVCSVLVIRGVSALSTKEAPPPVAAAPPSFDFDQRELLKALTPKQPEKEFIQEPTATSNGLKSRDIFETQTEKFWTQIEKYQKACSNSNSITKNQFMEGLRQTHYPSDLHARGGDFAQSQLQFVGESLSNPEIIELCKSGKSGIFMTILDQHRQMWDRRKRQLEEFEASQQRDIRLKTLAERERVQEAHAEGYQQLTFAAAAFGGFMALALVLIVARIESNLRGLRMGTSIRKIDSDTSPVAKPPVA